MYRIIYDWIQQPNFVLSNEEFSSAYHEENGVLRKGYQQIFNRKIENILNLKVSTESATLLGAKKNPYYSIRMYCKQKRCCTFKTFLCCQYNIVHWFSNEQNQHQPSLEEKECVSIAQNLHINYFFY